MAEEWPIPAFHFSVLIDNNSSETAFQEVSGIEQNIETEEYIEGGNASVYYLPSVGKNNKLTVKRGITTLSSPLAKWCGNCFKYKFKFTTKLLLVHLLDESHSVCRSWVFFNAYPISWKVEAFNSTKNEVAIEEIVFCFSRMSRSK